MENKNGLSEKQIVNLKIAKNYADIISRIITARKNANLTQRELANKCEIKQSAIARMESMKVVPRIDTILRIAAYLNIQIGIVKENTYVFNTQFYSNYEDDKIYYTSINRSLQYAYN